MKYKSLKCNILYGLSRIVPDKDFKMLCKEYLKAYDAAPSLAAESWKIYYGNYKFRKKYKDQFKIVSLGWDCMPRTLLTLGMLKPSKGVGEKSMPFDLIANHPHALTHFLENDFADYFAEEWTYNHESRYWCNAPWSGVFYPHDPDCDSTPEGLEKLQKRMRNRINNFREMLKFAGPVLFVLHKSTRDDKQRPFQQDPADIEKACKCVEKLRNGKPFKILVFVCDHNDTCRHIDGATVINLPYPTPDYVWHLDERFTPEGVTFETAFTKICRQELISMMKEIKLIK